METIAVLLIGDCPAWCAYLKDTLEKSGKIKVMKFATTQSEALNAVREQEWDVIVMDMHLGSNDYDGLDTIGEILKIRPQKIIMHTAIVDENLIKEAFKRGVINYITKNNSQDLEKAIVEAYNSLSSIHSDSAWVIRNSYAMLAREVDLRKLTPVERTVYELREKGLSRKEIAEHLGKSVYTVKLQIKSIRSKLTK